MCGIWSDSDDHLTTDPRTFLYSILYSKKAAVEAYTPPTHCPTALYLYSSYTAAIQQLYRLYSYTAIQQLYSIHPLQHPSGRAIAQLHTAWPSEAARDEAVRNYLARPGFARQQHDSGPQSAKKTHEKRRR